MLQVHVDDVVGTPAVLPENHEVSLHSQRSPQTEIG